VLIDVMRNKWALGYAVFFFVATDLLLRLSGTGPRALVGLLNLVLFIVPLVTMIFSAIYWHGAREFNELLLTQPVGRPALFHGLFAGLTIPLALAFVVAVITPLALHGALDADTAGSLVLLLIAGVMLTGAFAAMAVWIVGVIPDRLKGLGAALGAWLLLAIGYDALVLWISVAWSNYPIEPVLLGLTLANPIDLARVLLVLRFDIAALMGASAANIQQTLGGAGGIALAVSGLALWMVLPGLIALRAFKRRDF
jgi:Cu-processing system permease protein